MLTTILRPAAAAFGRRPHRLAGALLTCGLLALTPAPSQAGGYVMPVIERFIPAVPTPAPVAAQGPMICGQRPEICAIALLALLALLAGAGGGGHHGHVVTSPIDNSPLPTKPEPPVCYPDIQIECPGTKPPVTPEPLPPVAAVPLPAGLLLSASGLAALAALRRRRK